MKKMMLVAALLGVSFSANAEVVRLQVATHIQEGIHFKDLEQCFLYQTAHHDLKRDEIALELKQNKKGYSIGHWKKEVILEGKLVRYEITAQRAKGPKSNLRLQTRILVNGVVENAAVFTLNDRLQKTFPSNSLDALVLEDEAICYTANIFVQKQMPQLVPVALSQK